MARIFRNLSAVWAGGISVIYVNTLCEPYIMSSLFGSHSNARLIVTYIQPNDQAIDRKYNCADRAGGMRIIAYKKDQL